MDNKSFQCEICGKGFNTKAHLKQHLNKKYKCGLPLNNSSSEAINTEFMNMLKNKDMIISELKENNKHLTANNIYLSKQIKLIKNIINGKDKNED